MSFMGEGVRENPFNFGMFFLQNLETLIYYSKDEEDGKVDRISVMIFPSSTLEQ